MGKKLSEPCDCKSDSRIGFQDNLMGMKKPIFELHSRIIISQWIALPTFLFGLMRKNLRILLPVLLLSLFLGSCSNEPSPAKDKQEELITDEKLDQLGITHRDKLSAASKRALAWPELSNEWFGEFEVHDLKGDLAYEEGVVRGESD